MALRQPLLSIMLSLLNELALLATALAATTIHIVDNFRHSWRWELSQTCMSLVCFTQAN